MTYCDLLVFHYRFEIYSIDSSKMIGTFPEVLMNFNRLTFLNSLTTYKPGKYRHGQVGPVPAQLPATDNRAPEDR